MARLIGEERKHARLTLGELATWLQAAGAQPSADSPLAAAATAPPEGNEAQLRGRGLLDAPWRAALAALATPRRAVQVATPGAMSSRIAGFYSDGSAASLVGFWNDEQFAEISFPWDFAAIALESAKTLRVAEAPPRDPYAATLSPAGLLVLAAAVDTMRTRVFQAYLARRESSNDPLPVDLLASQWQTGLDQQDARWMVTLLRLLSPAPPPPLNERSVLKGAEDLVTVGLLHAQRDGFVATGRLMRLAAHWLAPLPAVAHSVVTYGFPARIEHRITIRGGGPLWNLDFVAGGQGVRLYSDEPGAFLRNLQTLLKPAMEMAPTAETDEVPEDVEVAEAVEVAQLAEGDGAASDATEDAPAPATAVACAACGARVPAGGRFCLQCGAPLSREQPAATAPRPTPPAASLSSAPKSPPVPQRCPNPSCGRPIQPGKRFCAGCGTRLATGGTP